MTPEAKIDYTAPEKHGTVSIRNCSAEEALGLAEDAVGEYFAYDDAVRRHGVEPTPTSDTDGQFDFTFFVYR